jgi:hypothetical protein
MAHSPEYVLAREQARAIRAARESGRGLAAWSVALAMGETRIVLAATDRGARSIAAADGSSVLRVGPAHVRDLDAFADARLARAAALAPAGAPAPAAPGARAQTRAVRCAGAIGAAVAALSRPAPGPARDAARDWRVTGEGPRPSLPPAPPAPRIPGMPRTVISARPRGGRVGQAYAGDGSRRAARRSPLVFA